MCPAHFQLQWLPGLPAVVCSDALPDSDISASCMVPATWFWFDYFVSINSSGTDQPLSLHSIFNFRFLIQRTLFEFQTSYASSFYNEQSYKVLSLLQGEPSFPLFQSTGHRNEMSKFRSNINNKSCLGLCWSKVVPKYTLFSQL